MSLELTAEDDLFAVPAGEDRYYLYAPLRRAVALVNGAGVAAVARALAGGEVSPEAAAFVAALGEQGLLGEGAPRPPLFPEGYAFCPHEVTLFPTSRCNLRCRYCYADAGHKSVEMPWDIARAAIELVATNAGLLGSPTFAVGFHGGGEPTMAWDLVTRCVEYAEERADALGLDVALFSATNGVLSPAKRSYLAEHFQSVTVSLDGPPDIQDYNRPTLNGRGSYAAVRATLLAFREAGLPFSIRSTITASTVHRIGEIVETFHREFGAGDLHIEPAWECGRCLTTGEQPPTDEEFLTHFLAAVEWGREHGVEVHYSGARLDVLTSKFCGAPGDSFTVLPEGVVTSCYEITEADDPRAGIFHYGHYDAARDEFDFDQEALGRLRNLSVEHLGFCRDCFCKWHCAGDCLAKVFQPDGLPEHRGSSRCGLNRALTKAQLARLIATEASPAPAEVQETIHA